MPHQVDVVDEVQVDRPGALFPPPFGVEIMIRLQKPRRPVDGRDLAEVARLNLLFRSSDQRIVPPVMPNGHRHGRRLRRLDQLDAAREGGCERLFDQQGQARLDHLQSVLDMDLIGCGEKHAVDPVGCEHLIERFQAGNVMPRRHFHRGGRRIDDAGQFRMFRDADRLRMAGADQTGADNGDADAVRHQPTSEQTRRTAAS